VVPDHDCGPPTTGILWNLSSSDHLKDRLARDTLEQLTDLVLSPLSGAGGPPLIQQNASEAEIFYNATGFLRCAGRPWGPEVRGTRRSHWVAGGGGSGGSGRIQQGRGADPRVEWVTRCPPPSQMSTDCRLRFL
jgi:hypothetical protein